MARDVIVLDTHVLLWWVFDPGQLSPTAQHTLDEVELHGGFASAISIWELAIKVKGGKLELPIGMEELVYRLERSAVIELLPVDTATWLRSVSLRWDHRDPADRVIVATALMRNLPLLTKDAAVHAFPEVTCTW